MFSLADISSETLGDVVEIVGFLFSFGAIAAVWGSMRTKIKRLEDEVAKWDTRCQSHREEFMTAQSLANTEFKTTVAHILEVCTDIKVSMATDSAETRQINHRLDLISQRVDGLTARIDEIMAARVVELAEKAANERVEKTRQKSSKE